MYFSARAEGRIYRTAISAAQILVYFANVFRRFVSVGKSKTETVQALVRSKWLAGNCYFVFII